MNKKIALTLLIAGCALIFICFGYRCCHNEKAAGPSNTLVILHTNDTHSQIEPDANGLGGILRRKAAIDSIRRAEKNVLVVDAGDAVQGTLFFYIHGGVVEQKMMNLMDVDIRILGNHEFDNGIDSLAAVLRLSEAEKISSNYNLDNTPLAGMFGRSAVRTYGDKKIGFIALNLDPDGIILKGNYDGLMFEPIIETANTLAKELRENEGVDAVVALTHIGYNPEPLVGDSALAVNSRGIDIIIGGHSHDVIEPGSARNVLTNLDGESVLIVQTGKAGRKLGKITVDLDNPGALPKYELIDIDKNFDSRAFDVETKAVIAEYKTGVDSIMTLWVARTEKELQNSDSEMLNFFTDWVFDSGSRLAPDVDLAIANKGGLRTVLPEGRVSKGHIIDMLPFRNYITVLDVKGSDLRSVFDVMAKTRGNGISRNVRATYDTIGGRANYRARDIVIDGRPLDDNATYRVATIDYLAKGGDYMKGLTRGTIVAQSPQPVFEDLVNHLTAAGPDGALIKGSPENRWAINTTK